MKHNPPNKKKKIIYIVGIVIFVALMVILGLTVGGKIIEEQYGINKSNQCF